jgi:hypothetical protein
VRPAEETNLQRAELNPRVVLAVETGMEIDMFRALELMEHLGKAETAVTAPVLVAVAVATSVAVAEAGTSLVTVTTMTLVVPVVLVFLATEYQADP